MDMTHIKKYAASPRKERKPTTSVTVVTNTDEPIAGSKFNLFRPIGINAPTRPAIIRFIIMAVARTAAIRRSSNHKA